MIDLIQARRTSLTCRGFAHTWDHGPAPIQVDDTQKPVLWVTRGHCTSCGLRRHRWMVPHTCEPIGHWEYTDPAGMRAEVHLVTQQDARAELARRDNVGTDVPPEVAQMEHRRRAATPGDSPTTGDHSDASGVQ